MRDNKTNLTQIGERFGAQIAALVSRGWLNSVTVEDVDEAYAYVSKFDGDTPLRVPLNVLSVDTAAFVAKPVIGSTAVIANADGNLGTPFFVAFEQIDAVSVKVGKVTIDVADDVATIVNDKTSLKIEADGITFNGGDLGGLVKVAELTKAVNEIKSDINELKNAVTFWLPVPSDGGLELKTSLTMWASSLLTPSADRDFANEKITQ